MPKRAPALYLEDILTSIEQIQKYTKGLSLEDFSNNIALQDSIIRRLEIIGEAARNIPEQTAAQYPGIPWPDMIAMRNKVIHEYFGVDLEILWKTVKENLPTLKDQVQAALFALKK